MVEYHSLVKLVEVSCNRYCSLKSVCMNDVYPT